MIFDRSPLFIPTESTKEQMEALRRELDDRLHSLTYQTDRYFELEDRYPDPRNIPVPHPVPIPQHPPRRR